EVTRVGPNGRERSVSSTIHSVSRVLIGRLKWLSVPALLVALLSTAPTASARSQGLIVFASKRDGSESLYSIRPDGTHLVRLTRKAGAQSPRVSPDGRSVVFEDGNYNLRLL